MINLEYFKHQIKDELEGGCDYAKLALEIRGQNANWSKTFHEMGTIELGHATNLYKMGEEYYKSITSPYSTTPTVMSDTWKCIADEYVTGYTKAKTMLDMYSK